MSNDLPTFPTSSLDDDTISSSSSYEDPPSTAVTIALTPPQPQPQPQPTLAPTPNPTPPQPPTDPPRLFQRLWTDEDELALLKGFRDFTATHAPTSAGHYHDTAPFYDHIKSVLQPHFNKSQLVEKLRRLKKKYRTNLSKIRSGMDFVFKSNHDQALFDISRDIWFNLPDRFYDDDSTPTPAPTPTPIPIANPSPISVARPANSSYVMSQVDLTGFSGNGGGGGGGGLPKLCTRKRSRGANAEKVGVVEGVENVNVNVNVNASNVGVGSSLQGLVEETVKNCLSPVLKDVVEDVVRSVGFKGGSVDERWRKQQVMELEVYSKRLELVQEQIKLSLEELRSVES